MRQVYFKVKGVDDFSKKEIGADLYQYEHAYPRLTTGDWIIYYYPATNQCGAYAFEKEISYYDKDSFQNCTGVIRRACSSIYEFIEKLSLVNVDVADSVSKKINQLAEQYKNC